MFFFFDVVLYLLMTSQRGRRRRLQVYPGTKEEVKQPYPLFFLFKIAHLHCIIACIRAGRGRCPVSQNTEHQHEAYNAMTH